jgi:hypothetical protein
MTYVISGRHYNKGIRGDDCTTLVGYWELGWESCVSHFYIKKLFSEGKITKDDTIVTRNEREFFYSSVFDNVISWEEFCELNVPEDQIIDIPSIIIPNQMPDYQNVDMNLLLDLDLDTDIEEKFKINSKFMIYCIRLRDHCSYRNNDIEVAKVAIKKFIDSGYKVFVVGQGTQFLENELPVSYVNLREYASLLNSKYCSFVVSPLSGIIHVANFAAREGLKVIIVDSVGERNGNENHPLFMGDCVNFKNLDITFLTNFPTEEVIYKSLEEFL